MAYHRLGLVARFRPAAWWRALIELVLLAAFAALFGVACVVVLGVAAQQHGRDFSVLLEGSVDPLTPLVQVLVIASILPAPFLAARIAGRNPRALCSTALRLRWGVLGRALAVVGALYAAQVLIDVLRAPTDPTVTPFRLELIAAFALAVPLQAAAEEFVFRGALPQILGQWGSPAWLAYALPAALFVAGHAYNWVGLVDIAVFAVCTAVLTWRTGGLEAGIALHAIGNTVFFSYGALGLVDPNATEIGAVQMLGATFMTVACTALLLWALRGAGPGSREISSGGQKPLVPADATA